LLLAAQLLAQERRILKAQFTQPQLCFQHRAHLLQNGLCLGIAGRLQLVETLLLRPQLRLNADESGLGLWICLPGCQLQ
jgi:hypothetical protein